jgi:hypothetical protein
MKLRSLLGALLAIVVILTLGLDVVMLQRHTFASTLDDDSFYYSQIARHVALGHGFTFDGLHRTNGFQPLWLFVLVPIFRWIPGDFAPLYATVALQIALVAASAAGIYALLCKRWGHAAAFATGLLLVAQPNASKIVRSGMETPLALALLVAIWWLWRRTRETPSNGWRWAQLGVACGLLWWTRLEAAAIIFPLVLICARHALTSSPRRALALLAPFTVAATAYVLWNRLVFQTWFAVSGMVKLTLNSERSWADHGDAIADSPWLGHELFTRLTGQFVSPSSFAIKVSYAVVSVFALGVLFRFRRPLADSIRRADAGLLLLGCAAIGMFHVWTLNVTEQWHHYPVLLATALLGGATLDRWRRWAPWLAAALSLAAVAHAATRTRHEQPRPNDVDCIVRAADWLRSHLDEKTPVGSWNAGRLGYFSHRTVINLDGLVNDVRFFHDVVEGHRLDEYLRRERIEWFADNWPGFSWALQIDAHDFDRQFSVVFTACPAAAPVNAYVLRRPVDR